MYQSPLYHFQTVDDRNCCHRIKLFSLILVTVWNVTKSVPTFPIVDCTLWTICTGNLNFTSLQYEFRWIMRNLFLVTPVYYDTVTDHAPSSRLFVWPDSLHILVLLESIISYHLRSLTLGRPTPAQAVRKFTLSVQFFRSPFCRWTLSFFIQFHQSVFTSSLTRCAC